MARCEAQLLLQEARDISRMLSIASGAVSAKTSPRLTSATKWAQISDQVSSQVRRLRVRVRQIHLVRRSTVRSQRLKQRERYWADEMSVLSHPRDNLGWDS